MGRAAQGQENSIKYIQDKTINKTSPKIYHNNLTQKKRDIKSISAGHRIAPCGFTAAFICPLSGSYADTTQKYSKMEITKSKTIT